MAQAVGNATITYSKAFFSRKILRFSLNKTEPNFLWPISKFKCFRICSVLDSNNDAIDQGLFLPIYKIVQWKTARRSERNFRKLPIKLKYFQKVCKTAKINSVSWIIYMRYFKSDLTTREAYRTVPPKHRSHTKRQIYTHTKL